MDAKKESSQTALIWEDSSTKHNGVAEKHDFRRAVKESAGRIYKQSHFAPAAPIFSFSPFAGQVDAPLRGLAGASK
jgi:hypothetical protein